MSNPEIIKPTVEKILSRLVCNNTEGVRAVWKNSVDEDMLAHACPVGFKQGRLTVAVDNPAYLHNLVLRRKEILSKIQSQPGGCGVSDIRFKMGGVG